MKCMHTDIGTRIKNRSGKVDSWIYDESLSEREPPAMGVYDGRVWNTGHNVYDAVHDNISYDRGAMEEAAEAREVDPWEVFAHVTFHELRHARHMKTCAGYKTQGKNVDCNTRAGLAAAMRSTWEGTHGSYEDWTDWQAMNDYKRDLGSRSPRDPLFNRDTDKYPKCLPGGV